jgi:hypothetical protein
MKTFRIAVFVAVIAASVLSSAQHGAVKPLDLAIDQIMQARSAAGDFNGAVLVARQGTHSTSEPLGSQIWSGKSRTICKQNLKLDP